MIITTVQFNKYTKKLHLLIWQKQTYWIEKLLLLITEEVLLESRS